MASAVASWRLTWRGNAAAMYRLSESSRKAIEHGIEGLDPHHPVFFADRCYPWRLWSYVMLPDKDANQNGAVIRTPWVDSGQSRNLVNVLAYHYWGQLSKPTTSSKRPCTHHPNRLYGECCFPEVYRVGCTSPLCVNPLHFQAGVRRAPPARQLVWNLNDGGGMACPGCEPCGKCGWDPCLFQVTPKIVARDRYCRGTVTLGPHTRTMWRLWRREAVLFAVSGLNEDDPLRTHAERYISRYLPE
jgi:hypothetical protein